MRDFFFFDRTPRFFRRNGSVFDESVVLFDEIADVSTKIFIFVVSKMNTYFICMP